MGASGGTGNSTGITMRTAIKDFVIKTQKVEEKRTWGSEILIN
jgi:hypothetical protein